MWKTKWSVEDIMEVLGRYFGDWVSGGHDDREDIMARNMRASTIRSR